MKDSNHFSGLTSAFRAAYEQSNLKVGLISAFDQHTEHKPIYISRSCARSRSRVWWRVKGFKKDLELEGFIHTLSPFKKANNKSKTPYFDCLVQTSNASKVRAVCYETKKRTTLHQAYSSKSPVKISGVKRLPSTSFSDSLEEHKIAKMAKITPTMTIMV
ncbi:PREDICTED: uncharacterized protein LOC107349614 [Acropora digitifera]|uniref:uncharacterized protein LOC107349614 n=1 Tax=Acropora digitifera TaxID=70779 RepID=UPI00077B0755|nr:PREDICTED: uncharacterized protein LOC107349614 [Acropora digitifera]